LGHVVNFDEFYFSAIVSQRDASRLFAKEIRSSQVRLRGQAGIVLPVRRTQIIPSEHEMLPSAALGWPGGGEVAVAMGDETGRRAREPFFEVHASVQPPSEAVILPGRSGKIRFQLPPQPLLSQWIRKLRQLVQSRYGL